MYKPYVKLEIIALVIYLPGIIFITYIADWNSALFASNKRVAFMVRFVSLFDFKSDCVKTTGPIFMKLGCRV